MSEKLTVEHTPLDGVLILTPARFGDARGFFSESWNRATMRDAGLDLEFVQDNHSLSARKGTLRGLHFQTPPMAQDKLVRCGRGALYDVAVDIRSGSATFGQWFGVELSAENGRQLLVPAGFAHGFVTLQDDTEICYKCTAPYAPDCDAGIAWDDPDIGVNWGISEPVLSDKDATAPTLKELGSPF
ncbi:dTDP-4-dehydrorhamnose 3,5-epimerase [Ascidiaceihabitans sp.]|uniref:dTDP-4-dehydrorhamnose 3,5-epimerase n=1 Tax=Ascidiaceihabitans sp. TaxID=1872644 RepID=UPI003297DA91